MSAGSAGCGHGEETRKEAEELLLSRTLNSLLLLLRNAASADTTEGPREEIFGPGNLPVWVRTNEGASGTQLQQLGITTTVAALVPALYFNDQVYSLDIFFTFYSPLWYAGDIRLKFLVHVYKLGG